MHCWYFFKRGANQSVLSELIVATTKAGLEGEARFGHLPNAGGRVLEVVLYCTLVHGKDLVEMGVEGVVR